jgi:hypothetical protein
VRRRAILSVRANPACPDDATAEKAVNEVWESCFSDTRPFDEVTYQVLPHHMLIANGFFLDLLDIYAYLLHILNFRTLLNLILGSSSWRRVAGWRCDGSE